MAYHDDHIIHVLAPSNPRRAGTGAAAHWDIYRNGMTIGQFIKADGILSKLTTDVTRGNIVVLPPGEARPEYAPRSRAAKQDGGERQSRRPQSVIDRGIELTDEDKRRIEELGVSVRMDGYGGYIVKHPRLRVAYTGGNLSFALTQIEMDLEHGRK